MAQEKIAGKVRWRLALPCILFMLLSSLDRSNVSFAAAAMSADLGFTPSQYGFGAGILFAGFLAGQYPSLYLLQRIGMRGWIACCALLWGLSAGALGLMQGHAAFYFLRVLVGIAEGGLAPGIVFYLSQFATEQQRARTFTLPMLAVPVSVIIGAPLSGWLLGLGHLLPLPAGDSCSWPKRFRHCCSDSRRCSGFRTLPPKPGGSTADERDWLAAKRCAPRFDDPAQRLVAYCASHWSVSPAFCGSACCPDPTA